MNIRPSILLLALLASGCASTQSGPVASPASRPVSTAVPATAAGSTTAPATKEEAQALASPLPVAPATAESLPASTSDAAKSPEIKRPAAGSRLFPGDDNLFKRSIAPRVDPVLAQGDKVALNFENVTVGNLATALLGDLLKLNYTIDAGGDTVVSLHTRQPLLRSQVLDVLDAVLLPHDLAIVRDNAGVYHVTKRTVTLGARPVVGASNFKDLSGSGTVIVPLNHIAAAEMAKILAPIAPKESIVYVDSMRNLLVLQGSKAQLGGWLEMVEAFDVDFLSGMSLGVFVLENANVNVVRDALQAMLGSDKSADPYGGATPAAPAGAAPGAGGAATAASTASAQATGPLGGLIRVFPVERLNALVVVTPVPTCLRRSKPGCGAWTVPPTPWKPAFLSIPCKTARPCSWQKCSTVCLADSPHRPNRAAVWQEARRPRNSPRARAAPVWPLAAQGAPTPLVAAALVRAPALVLARALPGAPASRP